MADNNYDPREVGGIQPVFCVVCGKEIVPLQSYTMNKENQRLHYPDCLQRLMLADKG